VYSSCSGVSQPEQKGDNAVAATAPAETSSEIPPALLEDATTDDTRSSDRDTDAPHIITAGDLLRLDITPDVVRNMTGEDEGEYKGVYEESLEIWASGPVRLNCSACI
jgi:hypothetical protein